MGTYSFVNVAATLTGPGGAFSIGAGAGNAKEGISIEMIEDKNMMVIGADGTPMHSLRASRGCRVSVRLLKTSPVNAMLSDLYNFQQASSANWGQNVLVVSDIIRGDVETVSQAAFSKFPGLTWSEDAGMNEWTFMGVVDHNLGVGIPDLNT